MALPQLGEVERVAGEQHAVGGEEAGVAERVAGQRDGDRARVVPLLEVPVDAAALAAEELRDEQVARLRPREHAADVHLGVLDERRVVARREDRGARGAQHGAEEKWSAWPCVMASRSTETPA